MKIKEGFMLRKVGNQSIVVAVGEASRNFNGIIRLNETGEILWNTLSEDCGQADLVDKILDVYDTDRDTAQRDVEAFVMKLREADLLA